MEEQLIAEVRKRSYLYDHKSPMCRDKHRRYATWEEIGKKLNLSARSTKDAWEKLRRCHWNAISRRKRATEYGEKPLAPWKHEEDMAFLLPHCTRRNTGKSEPNDDTDLTFDGFDETKSRDFDPLEEVTLVKNEVPAIHLDSDSPNHNVLYESNRRVSVAGMESKGPEKKKPRFHEPQPRPEPSSPYADLDEIDLFFLSMAKTTKTLSAIEQAKVKLQVSQTVFQAQIACVTTQQTPPASCITEPKRSDSAASLNLDF
ncbi:uncharacterized protein LOC128743815 [Sabethes cyaneus]|uniref:uncharacterized protein LOC128743815 n=1 Tax=Sabethes cyaneus TaxID=53552 RepID=UPI00237D5A91|nr:uncharacterized protein LOC128743815 [Sabethes cyaneus]